jgi:large-conductance mechanosensitive channel
MSEQRRPILDKTDLTVIKESDRPETILSGLINTVPQPKRLYEEFQEFVYKNNLIATSAGFSIGIITAEFVKSFVNSVLLPIFSIVFYSIFPNSIMPVPKMTYDLLIGHSGHFVLNMVYWIAILFSAFFLLEFIFARQIVGTKSTLVGERRMEFEEVREKTRRQSVTPHDFTFSTPASVSTRDKILTTSIREPEAVNESFVPSSSSLSSSLTSSPLSSSPAHLSYIL